MTELQTRRMAARTTPAERLTGLNEIDQAVADELDAADVEKKAAEAELDDVNAKLRRLNPPAILREEIAGKRSIDFDLHLDEVDRRVAIDDLEAERVTVSRRLKRARAAHDVVHRRAVNLMLIPAVADWKEQANAKTANINDVQLAIGRMFAAVLALGESTRTERAAARSVGALAAKGVSGIDAHDGMRHLERTGRVPVTVDADGAVQTVDRPDDGIFGDDEFDLRGILQLAEFAFNDPAGARRQLSDTAIGRVAFPDQR
jgi:hypothetical protein